ncbi:hypothetical protein AAH979_05300 [Plantactinospora sp. ZYX-F-223]|uniref:hypothetical protein n=1 Tax=Plantactinospora sp. ZYX-F-223 TaxID=3144103 RepID=UPI0031FC3937
MTSSGRQGSASSLLLFSGFGASGPGLVRQLQNLYRRPGDRQLLEVAAEAVDRAVHRFGADGARHLTPDGIPLRGWFRGQAPITPAALRSSVVEGLLTHLMHLCLLRPDARAAWSGPVIGLGHSLGLISAVIATLRPDGGQQQFLRDAHESMAMTTLTLLRCQQAAGDPHGEPGLVRRYAQLSGAKGRPGPMVAVSGLAVDRLRDLLAEHLAEGGRPVELGLVNGPCDAVLCGSTSGLLELWLRHRAAFAGAGAGYAFLRSTVPFHNSRLAPVLDHLNADRAWAGTSITSARLAAPVYATDFPRNLQRAGDLYADCLSQVICRPLDWSATVRSVMAEHRPSRAFDFGPGIAVRMFTRKCLEPQGDVLEYIPVRPATAA